MEVERAIIVPFEWRDPTPGGSNLGRASSMYAWYSNVASYKSSLFTRHSYVWIHAGTCLTRGFNDFTTHSYDGLDNANTWMATYCKEHKAFMLAIYAPTGAKFLRIDSYGLSFMTKAVQPIHDSDDLENIEMQEWSE